ncbi:MAG: sulfate adenylyltransferase [Candidatus Aminicenantes bacterium]|nr:sulfate adenylyltransferase [Candidatus Aminicenantes bacterium]
MSQLILPHRGELSPLLVDGKELKEKKERSRSLIQVRMSSRETSDLIMMAIGAFTPLKGFMVRQDYTEVVDNMHLSDGTLWPIPITLSVSKQEADNINLGQEIGLTDDDSGDLMGIMKVQDKYNYDKEYEAKQVFRTSDIAHPGVNKVYQQNEVLLGGEVTALSEGPYPELYGSYYARPSETRDIFQKKGWSTISAFQTRNPIHRSHEYCTKIALEVSDGILIHPLVGKLKADDIPAEVRMKCYEVLLEQYYPQERVVLKVYPMEMRYGGPREALLHAIFRQNYGCSHLIIGRDHAGVGNYYGPFDAQKIFTEIEPEELHIQPLNIDWTFWCHKCDGMASMKTCPHKKEHRVLISGTKVREMLSKGQMPPKEFSRPEVAEILIDHYKQTRHS